MNVFFGILVFLFAIWFFGMSMANSAKGFKQSWASDDWFEFGATAVLFVASLAGTCVLLLMSFSLWSVK